MRRYIAEISTTSHSFIKHIDISLGYDWSQSLLGVWQSLRLCEERWTKLWRSLLDAGCHCPGLAIGHIAFAVNARGWPVLSQLLYGRHHGAHEGHLYGLLLRTEGGHNGIRRGGQSAQHQHWCSRYCADGGGHRCHLSGRHSVAVADCTAYLEHYVVLQAAQGITGAAHVSLALDTQYGID